MENASKAILIAGGVLVALLVISIAMYIIGQARGTVLSAEERRLQTIKQEQVNKFSQYAGNIYGSEVENCIRRVASYNKDKVDSEKMTVNIKRGTDEILFDGSMDELISLDAENKIKVNITAEERNDNNWFGTINYRINGTIEDITFEYRT